MAYTINNNSHKHRPSGKSLANTRTLNNIDGGDFYEIEPAEVLDIILDETHPDFESYEDIGKIRG